MAPVVPGLLMLQMVTDLTDSCRPLTVLSQIEAHLQGVLAFSSLDCDDMPGEVVVPWHRRDVECFPPRSPHHRPFSILSMGTNVVPRVRLCWFVKTQGWDAMICCE